MNHSSPRYIVTLVGIAFAMLLILSAIPWTDLTGNVIKDFNLFEDLFPSEKKVASNAPEIVDPELADLMAQADEIHTTADNEKIDSTVVDQPITQAVSIPAVVPSVYEAPINSDGTVLIENFSASAEAFPHFKAALTHAGERNVRVAVIGDSYIEGDIFCQDLRKLLQDEYGGEGVGFMAMHSDFPGFRGSVTQSSSGWILHDIRKMNRNDSLRTLSGDYARAQNRARSTYKATKSQPSWSKASYMFIAADSATITLSADGVPSSFDVGPSHSPQRLVLDGPMKEFSINSPEGIVGLGAYLDGTAGIQVDCMSVRGNSGLSLGKLNPTLCNAMRQYIDYDLIILEFGMNILSAEQTNYNTYGKGMLHAVERVKACYPNADILIMGVGDRGVKDGPNVVSMPTCHALIKAQRELAQNTGAFFWDTHAAMGGDGAALKWRNNNLLNADYIHLNHKGGGRLADIFFRSLKQSL